MALIDQVAATAQSAVVVGAALGTAAHPLQTRRLMPLVVVIVVKTGILLCLA